MIRSILSVPEEKLKDIDNIHPAILLTAYERSILKELCEMLQPFEVATTYAQKENTVSSSLVVLCVRGLFQKLAALSARYNGSLMNALKDASSRRLAVFEESATFQAAAMLDPRFKLHWARPGEKETMQQLLTDLAESMLSSAGDANGSLEPPAKWQRQPHQMTSSTSWMKFRASSIPPRPPVQLMRCSATFKKHAWTSPQTRLYSGGTVPHIRPWNSWLSVPWQSLPHQLQWRDCSALLGMFIGPIVLFWKIRLLNALCSSAATVICHKHKPMDYCFLCSSFLDAFLCL